MRKVLRIIAVSAGIISVVSTVILGFIYLEDFFSRVQSVKEKITEKINDRRNNDEDYYFDEV